MFAFSKCLFLNIHWVALLNRPWHEIIFIWSGVWESETTGSQIVLSFSIDWRLFLGIRISNTWIKPDESPANKASSSRDDQRTRVTLWSEWPKHDSTLICWIKFPVLMSINLIADEDVPTILKVILA